MEELYHHQRRATKRVCSGIPQQVSAPHLEDQARRWVERVFSGQPTARQAMERSKSPVPRGRERSRAPRGQWMTPKGCAVGRRCDRPACGQKPSATWRQRRRGASVIPKRGQHPSSKRCPRPQVPAETAARVASRTKRATVRSEVKMSTKRDAWALLARPNQGERFTPGRAWMGRHGEKLNGRSTTSNPPGRSQTRPAPLGQVSVQ